MSWARQQDGMRFHHTQNSMQFKTYGLFISGIFHLVFSNHGFLWVAKSVGSIIMDKEGLLCVTPFGCISILSSISFAFFVPVVPGPQSSLPTIFFFSRHLGTCSFSLPGMLFFALKNYSQEVFLKSLAQTSIFHDRSEQKQREESPFSLSPATTTISFLKFFFFPPCLP